jgi:hypothetical protein
MDNIRKRAPWMVAILLLGMFAGCMVDPNYFRFACRGEAANLLSKAS